jgi:hypothetical protein
VNELLNRVYPPSGFDGSGAGAVHRGKSSAVSMSAAAYALLAEEAADARPHASANNAHLHAAIFLVYKCVRHKPEWSTPTGYRTMRVPLFVRSPDRKFTPFIIIKVAPFPRGPSRAWPGSVDPCRSIDPDLRLLCQESRDLSHTQAGPTGA